MFMSRTDNQVRPLPTTWENIVGLFTFGHEVVENKEDVNLFNTAHYKEVNQVPDYSEDLYEDLLTGRCFTDGSHVGWQFPPICLIKIKNGSC